MLPSLNELIKKLDEFDNNKQGIYFNPMVDGKPKVEPTSTSSIIHREQLPIHSSSYYSSTTCNSQSSMPCTSLQQHSQPHNHPCNSNNCYYPQPNNISHSLNSIHNNTHATIRDHHHQQPQQYSTISQLHQASVIHVDPPTPFKSPTHYHEPSQHTQNDMVHVVFPKPTLEIPASGNKCHVASSPQSTCIKQNDILNQNTSNNFIQSSSSSFNQCSSSSMDLLINHSNSNSPNNSSAHNNSTNAFQSMYNVNKKSSKNKISKKSKEPIQFKAFSLSLDTSKIKFINEQHQKIGINDGSWTEKEHADFIRGLNECGKGRWREISEGYVKTRTR